MLPRQWKQSVTNLVGIIAEILKRYVFSIFNYQTIERLNSHEIAISQIISCWEGNGLKDWRLSKRSLSARRGICLLNKRAQCVRETCRRPGAETVVDRGPHHDGKFHHTHLLLSVCTLPSCQDIKAWLGKRCQQIFVSFPIE